MPLPGFEPGASRPQSKSDVVDRSAMGLTFRILKNLDFWGSILGLKVLSEVFPPPLKKIPLPEY